MRLWIDDLRPAPEGWYWAKTSAEALLVIRTGRVKEVSFDHDLGGDDTTRPVILWMSEFGRWPERVYIHSANPVGRDWMEGMINRYGPGVTKE